MRRKVGSLAMILILCFVTAFPMSAPAAEEEAKKEDSRSQMFTYKPPMRGAPGNRIGGGTRGAGDDLPEILVLAPDHLGLTTQAQPVLYWYLSGPTTKPVEFTLNDEQAGNTLFKTNLGSRHEKGIHRLRLSDYKVTLSPGVPYRWFVSLIVDPDQPSKNLYAGGLVQYQKPSKEFLAGKSKTEIPSVYASEGIWYDALSSLSELIETHPKDKALREQRAFLLEQVGLPKVAEYERNP